MQFDSELMKQMQEAKPFPAVEPTDDVSVSKSVRKELNPLNYWYNYFFGDGALKRHVKKFKPIFGAFGGDRGASTLDAEAKKYVMTE